MFDISKLINKNFKREIWKMDTSHFSILQKFLLNSNNKKIDVNEVSNNRYQFFNPTLIKRDSDPGFSKGAIGQYIRILVFYNVISHNVIESLKCSSWSCVFEEMLNGNLNMEVFGKEPESYLIDNFNEISFSIKEQVNSENQMIRLNAIKILSTMETFINYKNSPLAKELKVENFNKFLREYEYEIDAIRPDGSDEGYIDELKNWIKMYDYCEELLNSLLGSESTSDEIEDSFGKIDFTGYGYIGEYIYNEYLERNNIDHKWVSVSDKYSPYDFQVEDNWVEVKTATNKRNKISFNLSWNEYIHHQAKKEKYKILYIDGVYNIDIKKIIRNGIQNLDLLMQENEIIFHELTYKEIREYRFAPKGYWVSEK